MNDVFINGRFLARRPTGVDRFAIETLRALDELLERPTDQTTIQIILLVPATEQARALELKNIKIVPVGRLKGALWEQLELPWLTRGKLLLNLCNAAPVLKHKQMVVIHDAAPARVPESYSWGFRIWYGLLMPWLGRVALRVLTVSEFSRNELTLAYGIPPEKITVLPESGEHILRILADETILEQFDLHRRPYILGVSSMSPHKNFATLIRAVELLGRDCGFDVVIAGAANPRIFASADLPLFVKHVGYVSDEALRALYEHAACFVFPSYYEGFGLPAAEAMALGCPVIAANAASIPEVCGDYAIYFESCNSESLALQIKLIMTATASRSPDSDPIRVISIPKRWLDTAISLLSVIIEYQHSNKDNMADVN